VSSGGITPENLPAGGDGLERLRVLIVEDRPEDAELTLLALERAGFAVTAVRVESEADYRAAIQGDHDVILSDHSLPQFDSTRALEIVGELGVDVPFIIVSGTIGEELAVESMKRGASDYLLKGSLARLGPAVAHAIEERHLRHQKRDAEAALDTAWKDSLRRMAHAVEYRDPDTGGHIERMSHYCAAIAQTLGLDANCCELIELASPMHDVGKVAIPDAILLKPGPLDATQRENIQRHAEIGHRLLAGSDSVLLETAATIALTHHEHWDGSGYPRALRADEIPRAGRIAAVADVFDALTSDRPYRPAMPLEAAIQLMSDERGKHFDTDALDALLDNLDAIEAIRHVHAPSRVDLNTPIT
jgi:putative two-component system response regulator